MNNKISKKQLKNFGLIIGILFPLLIGIIIPLLYSHSYKFWTIYLGLTLIITGLFKPDYLYLPYKAWMFIGHTLGKINSKLILGIIFFLLLLPISIILKIFNYFPLKKICLEKKSYKEVKLPINVNLNNIF